jgi:hypothetical protein
MMHEPLAVGVKDEPEMEQSPETFVYEKVPPVDPPVEVRVKLFP